MSQENVTSPEQGTDPKPDVSAQSTTDASSSDEKASAPITVTNEANEASAPSETAASAAEKADTPAGDEAGDGASAPPNPVAEAAEKADAAAAEEDDDDDADAENFGNRKRSDDVPDDIGNRLGGAAPQGEAGAGKKRRRRKKKGPKPEGAPGPGPGPGAEAGAEGAAPAEGEAEGDAEEGEAEAEGEEAGKSKRPRGDKGPPRERPAFGVGEEVFGRVCKVTDHAVWVDIAGKAVGLFDKRELQHTDSPVEEGDQFIATVASSGVRGGMLMLSQTMPELDKLRERLEGAQKR